MPLDVLRYRRLLVGISATAILFCHLKLDRPAPQRAFALSDQALIGVVTRPSSEHIGAVLDQLVPTSAITESLMPRSQLN